MKEGRSAKFYTSKLLSGSVAMMLSSMSLKLVKLFILPIMTYYLSPEDFGIIASIKMVQGFLLLLYNPGVVSGTTRLFYDTEDVEERKTLIGSSLLFFLLFSILTAVVLIATGDLFFNKIFNEFELYPYGIIAILLSILIQPKRLWSALLTFQYRVKKIALISIIQMLIEVSISLYLVTILLWGVEGRVIGMTIGIVFLFLISIITIYKYTEGKIRFFSFKKMKKILAFSLPLAPAIWAYSALDIADRFLIEHYIGLDSLGVYSIAYILSSVPLFFSVGFRKMWNPVFYENMNKKNYKYLNSLLKGFVVFNALICSFLILFSEEIVHFALSKEFGNVKMIIPWVTLGVFFLGLLPLSSSFISYEKKFHKISINAGISAVINIVLNIILLPKIGVIGSAIATFVAYFFYFFLNLLVVGKLFFKVSSLKVFVVPFIVLIASLMLYYKLETSLINVVYKLILLALSLAFIYFSNYFTKQEISFFVNLLKRKK